MDGKSGFNQIWNCSSRLLYLVNSPIAKKSFFMRRTLGLFALLLSGAFAFSQECGTDIVYSQMIKDNPEIKVNKEAVDAFCKEYIKQHSNIEQSSAVKIIPVVFHILHNYGTENISEAQVITAVNQLNLDYRKLRADTSQIVSAFKPIHADCEIEFRLAKLDPLGNCTNGITRTQTSLTYNANSAVKQLINWEHTEYLNIWVVHDINIGTPGVAAYATYPGAGNNQDGIVCANNYVGTIGTSNLHASNVLAHEAGHYLNLPHTWGQGNACGDLGNCGIDDGIGDTPNTLGNCQVCNLTSNTCGVLDNVQNFMDYAHCSAQMFTDGQKGVMDAALNTNWTGRKNLWSATNILNTGVSGSPTVCIPIADFFANTQFVCVGVPVTFNDASWNGSPTSWNWSFPGASITSSTNSSETVTYTSAGVYTVSLSVGNSSGTDQISKTSYIQVLSSTATYSVSNYTEDFEGTSIPNSNWTIFDEDGSNGWSTTSSVAYTGNKCIHLDNFLNTSYGTTDDFLSVGFNCTAVQYPVLSFMLSYAQQNNEDDVLEVFASSDCGQTWDSRYLKYGSMGLATSSSTWSYFTPTNPTDWRKEYVNLAPFMNSTNVRFRFKFTSALGNNIYIDDINLSTFFTGIEDKSISKNSMVVYPNPLENNSVITVKLLECSTIQLGLFDVTGRKVLNIATGEKPAGDLTFSLDKETLSKGIYLLKLDDGKASFNLRVVVD